MTTSAPPSSQVTGGAPGPSGAIFLGRLGGSVVAMATPCRGHPRPAEGEWGEWGSRGHPMATRGLKMAIQGLKVARAQTLPYPLSGHPHPLP